MGAKFRFTSWLHETQLFSSTLPEPLDDDCHTAKTACVGTYRWIAHDHTSRRPTTPRRRRSRTLLWRTQRDGGRTQAPWCPTAHAPTRRLGCGRRRQRRLRKEEIQECVIGYATHLCASNVPSSGRRQFAVYIINLGGSTSRPPSPTLRPRPTRTPIVTVTAPVRVGVVITPFMDMVVDTTPCDERVKVGLYTNDTSQIRTRR